MLNQYQEKSTLTTNWCTLPTDMGNFRMHDTGNENIRLVTFGDINQLGTKPLVRIHSSCLASEVFGARDCDCADQLRETMKLMATEGQGIIIHIHQEGRGHGLSHKIHAVRLMEEEKLDTHEAYQRLGLEQDIRNYDEPIEILRQLGLSNVRLISNNPRKIDALRKAGINVTGICTHPKIRPENAQYLETKNTKLNHTIPLNDNKSESDIHFYHSDQPWGEFSNFSRHAIFINNKIWPTSEHFYQAQKFQGTEHEEIIRRRLSPMAAKDYATKFRNDVRKDWESEKDSIMYQALKAKFTQHPELAELLISTGSRNLIEKSPSDSYWGIGKDGQGKNRLGQLLMQIRAEI